MAASKRYWAWWAVVDGGRNVVTRVDVEELSADVAFGVENVVIERGVSLTQAEGANRSVYLDNYDSQIFEGPRAKVRAGAWAKEMAKAAKQRLIAQRKIFERRVGNTIETRPLYNDDVVILTSYGTPVAARVGQTCFATTRKYSVTTNRHAHSFYFDQGCHQFGQQLYAIPEFFRTLLDGEFSMRYVVGIRALHTYPNAYDTWKAGHEAGTITLAYEGWLKEVYNPEYRAFKRRPEIRANEVLFETLAGNSRREPHGTSYMPPNWTEAERRWLSVQPAFISHFTFPLDVAVRLALNWPQDWLVPMFPSTYNRELVIERLHRIGVEHSW